MNERTTLAPEPSFAYIRIDFNSDLSLDPNLDPNLDFDSNMPLDVEMDLAIAGASGGRSDICTCNCNKYVMIKAESNITSLSTYTRRRRFAGVHRL